MSTINATNSGTINAVIYARYEKKSTGWPSIENQLAACREYAAQNGLTIVGEYFDDRRIKQKPSLMEYNSLLHRCSLNSFKVILTYHFHLFGRKNTFGNLMDHYEYIKPHGVKLICVNEKKP